MGGHENRTIPSGGNHMTAILERAAIAASEAAEAVPAELHGSRGGWLIVARAVLMATREPSDEAITKACGGEHHCEDLRIHFTATIDTILNEGLE